MTENYKIVSEFIKDMSSETPDIETYLFVKENITKYHLAINITSKALKNKMIEVCTTIKYEDKEASE
jgi:preprotein translocase subunit SecB